MDYNILIDKNEEKSINYMMSSSILTIDVLDNIEAKLYLFIKYKGINTININLKEYSKFTVVSFLEGSSNELTINVTQNEKSSFKYFECNLSKDSKTYNKINLNGIEASAYVFNILVENELYKAHKDIDIYHNAKSTNCSFNNYAIAKDNASIVLDVKAYIKEGMTKSNTAQINKGIILSENASIEASPKLFISENDVFASHGAAIGRMNDNELYYLMSRGLTLEASKQILIKGFIKPYLDNFKLNETYDWISSKIFDEIRG